MATIFGNLNGYIPSGATYIITNGTTVPNGEEWIYIYATLNGPGTVANIGGGYQSGGNVVSLPSGAGTAFAFAIVPVPSINTL